MLAAQTTNTVKPEWFGKRISVVLSNGQQLAGELSEVSQKFLIVKTAEGETQVMVHAIALIRLADSADQ